MTQQKSSVIELLESVVIAVVLAALIRIFIFSPFYIPSGSMEPTLQVGDRIIVSKINYRFTEPERGDVMVFKFPEDPNKDFVKRVIGLEGETLFFRDSQLYVDEEPVEEDYLPEDMQFHDFGPYEVPEDSYFMMGDNRNNSDDSRRWGPMPEENIVGEAVLIYWPPGRVNLLN
ncbi:MAG: signal peptidase I [Clostridiales bacterium]|nr:signal peptidase I [Clostridiales bacterium]MCF8022612.1 signal peptidase I [Clostridiales bacterium]